MIAMGYSEEPQGYADEDLYILGRTSAVWRNLCSYNGSHSTDQERDRTTFCTFTVDVVPSGEPSPEGPE
ncbi:unnamed protein product [Arctogadus glacialis]